MKKNIVNFSGIIILLFSFQVSKANLLPGKDSSSPKLGAQSVQDPPVSFNAFQWKDKPKSELQKFIFSLTLTPYFKTSIPPVNVYFEHGIAGLATAGLSVGALYDSQSEGDYQSATITVGVRGCAYAFPIISKISGKEINSFGLQPYLGLVYDYEATAVSITGYDFDPYHRSQFGVVAGTRWYPGKGKFGLLGEFNSNGLGSNLRVGISLGR